MATTQPPNFIRLTGHKSLTYRLVLSTLMGRPVHISQIRSSSPASPGLASHEVSFLRLLESVTNGSAIDISYSGTTLAYQPGLITGSVPGQGVSASDDSIEHVIPASCASRGVTYFLLPLALLAPFSKNHVNVRLKGPGCVTAATQAGDLSIDAFRTSILPLYGLFGIPPVRIEVRIHSRACESSPLSKKHANAGASAGGCVELRFASQVRLPKTLHLNRRMGRVRRIRGVAYATGVSASNNGRMITAAREVLDGLVPDMHVAALYDPAPAANKRTLQQQQQQKQQLGQEQGARRKTGIGFGICLVAESSAHGVLYSADEVAPPEGDVVAEDIGQRCAYQLLELISGGGCIAPAAAPTVMILMAMGSEDVGRVRLGKDVMGSEGMVRLARDVKKFSGSAWGLREVNGEDGGSGDMLVSVKGTGVGNVGRKVA